MPNPMPGDVHVNTILGTVSSVFYQKQDQFVADQVFPILPVQHQSDRFLTWNKGDWNRDEMKKRAPATETAGGGFRLDNTPTYICDVRGLHKDVDDQIRANQDPGIDMDTRATNYVTLQALIHKEKLWADAFFKAGVWTGDQTGVAGVPGANQFVQWNDVNSTPIENIRAQMLVMRGRALGYAANVLVLGAATYAALLDHPDIIDRIKYTSSPGNPAMVNKSTLAQLFEVDKVLVTYAQETTSNEQAATDTFAFINNPKGAMLAYAEPSPDVLSPSAGYTFSWTGYLGAQPQGQRIKRFRMEHLAADRIEIEIAMQQKIVSADLGIFWISAVA